MPEGTPTRERKETAAPNGPELGVVRRIWSALSLDVEWIFEGYIRPAGHEEAEWRLLGWLRRALEVLGRKIRKRLFQRDGAGGPAVLRDCAKVDALAYVRSRNQLDAVRPLCSGTEEHVVVGDVPDPAVHPFPMERCYLVAALLMPAALLRWGMIHKAPGARGLWRIALCMGFHFVATGFVGGRLPRVAILPNDHSLLPRVFRQVCGELGVRTCYVPHASVTERFPPLEFDFALLDGVETLQKYDREESAGCVVFLVGNPQLDAYASHVKSGDTVRRVGICSNPASEFGLVARTVRRVVRAGGWKRVVLRPHPSQVTGSRSAARWSDRATELGVELSDPGRESAFQFLDDVDAVVAGGSNILLEAAVLNVAPIVTDFGQRPVDGYGFAEAKIVHVAEDSGAVVECLEALRDRKRERPPALSRFNVVVGTDLEGESGRLAREVLGRIKEGGPVGNSWARVKSPRHLTVFAPREIAGRVEAVPG